MGKKKAKGVAAELILADPFEEMHQMQMSMDRLFGSMFPMDMPSANMRSPAASQGELINQKSKYIAKLHVPNMGKEDFEIEVHPHLLRVMAQRKIESKKKGAYSYSSSSYSRQFVLPEEADSHKVSARYKNDVLTIEISKAKKKKSKKIKVK